MMATANIKPRSALLAAMPYQIEANLKTLGRNLRIARLRRNLTTAEVGEKIGTSRYAIADAEKGKPSTSMAIYAALMWAYGLTDQLAELADPSRDAEGAALGLNQERLRARHRRKLNNEF
jgi:transcriptional regulator with XRE-family HTH domain